MSIYDQVKDLHSFLNENQINDKVTLIGHSLGGKVAMAYSLLHPERVQAICSIDSSPVDRNEFPEMNTKTLRLIESAKAILPQIESKTYKEAYNWLRSILSTSNNKILIASMMMNLDKTSMEKARLLTNVNGLAKSETVKSMLGFPIFKDHSTNDISANNMLFINGADSFLNGVANDCQFYQHIFPQADPSTLKIID